MCGSLEKRGDGDRQTDRETERETETDLDSRVLSDSFGAVGPKRHKISEIGKMAQNRVYAPPDTP